MNKEIIQRKLSINCLSDDMIKCAIEKGFKIPVVSIKHHYKKAAQFIERYTAGKITVYELDILNNKNKVEAVYLMEG